MQNDYSELITALFTWYDANRRDLPWRKERNPYKSWISEVMLQQTRVGTVIPYFNRFLTLFPDIPTLAAAEPDDIYKAWEGLGYYSRAANLLKGARYIIEHHEGVFPEDKVDIQKIPGIGPYIAGAILSMAFGEPEPSVDGNLIRVISRLNALTGTPDTSSTRKAITSIAREMISKERPGDFNEAMMDIGATICTPRSPSCADCPFRALCKANQSGIPELFPGIKKSAAVPSYPFTVCAVLHNDRIWIRKRASEGLLAGLYEFSMFPGHLSEEDAIQELFSSLGVKPECPVKLTTLPSATHRFSHMIWDMKGYIVTIPTPCIAREIPLSFTEAKGTGAGKFYSFEDAQRLAFPTAIRSYTEAVFAAFTNPG